MTELENLDDAALGALDVDVLADAFVAQRRPGHFAQRVVAVHPALRDPARRRGVIARLIEANRTATRPEELLLAALFRASLGDPAVSELASSVAWGTDLAAHEALDLLIAQGHAETLARLDRELEEAIAARPPVWTNGHATEWLAPSVRAAFLRAGHRGSERFAAYFTNGALSTEAGLQVAASILMIGNGFVARHQVTERTSDGPVIASDPRFFALASRLTGHPKLKRLASDVLKLVPAKDRKAILAAHPAGTFGTAKAPKKKPASYREGDRLRMFVGLRDWRGIPVTIAKVHESGHLEIERTDGLRSAMISPTSFAPLEP